MPALDLATFVEGDLRIGAKRSVHGQSLCCDEPLVSLQSRTSSLNPPGYIQCGGKVEMSPVVQSRNVILTAAEARRRAGRRPQSRNPDRRHSTGQQRLVPALDQLQRQVAHGILNAVVRPPAAALMTPRRRAFETECPARSFAPGEHSATAQLPPRRACGDLQQPPIKPRCDAVRVRSLKPIPKSESHISLR